MANRNDHLMTLVSQGKFIDSDDRRAFEARARALRAEAVRQTAKAIGDTVRGWFARRPATAHRHNPIGARAA